MSGRGVGVGLALAAALGSAAALAQHDVALVALRVFGAGAEPGTLVVQVAGAEPFAATTTADAAPHLASYAILPAATSELTLLWSDDGADGAARRAGTVEVDLAAGGYFTLVVWEAPAGDGGDERATGIGPRASLLGDEIDTLPAAGRAGLRVVHAAPTVGAIGYDLRLLPAGDGFALGGDESGATAPGLAAALEGPGDAIRIELPAGDYDLVVGPAGSALGGHEPSRHVLRPGTVYTLFVTGIAGEGDVAHLVIDAGMPHPPQWERR